MELEQNEGGECGQIRALNSIPLGAKGQWHLLPQQQSLGLVHYLINELHQINLRFCNNLSISRPSDSS